MIRKHGAEHDERRVIMLTDANAADTEADHNAALCAVYTTFGDIMPTEMVAGPLSNAARRSDEQNED